MASLRTVYIQPTTGGQMEIRLAPDASVSNLKRAVANRLKVPKDKIVLLHKNKQLTEGSLDENHLVEGARLTLLPSVETGLMTQRPEQCVMQALETLNDSQVDNFLAGRAPLNLTMRLGDHMMFIQLQLSTSVPSSGSSTNVSSSSTSSSSLSTPPTTPTSPTSPTSLPRFPLSTVHSYVPPSPPPSPKMATPPAEAAACSSSTSSNPKPSLNAQALAEASRNLTQTLRQLSSAALTRKMNESCDGRCCNARSKGGAVIESMYHHGRGVYSGTFSGTLSPSLQDKDGRPRRDISTIIHILNDLLGASSHCRPSAQCLCSPGTIPHTDSETISSLDLKLNGENQKQDENQVLRQKVEQIQSMLEERRLKRKARRDVRSAPYCTGNRTLNKREGSTSAGVGDTVDSRGSCLSRENSSISADCGDQKMTDYSSETAVA